MEERVRVFLAYKKSVEYPRVELLPLGTGSLPILQGKAGTPLGMVGTPIPVIGGSPGEEVRGGVLLLTPKGPVLKALEAPEEGVRGLVLLKGEEILQVEGGKTLIRGDRFPRESVFLLEPGGRVVARAESQDYIYRYDGHLLLALRPEEERALEAYLEAGGRV